MNVVILAGGLGKRMGNPDLPKVLVPLRGRPIISYIIDAVKESGVDSKPTVVVGKNAEMIKSALGDSCDYVWQKEQLGTGHAVLCTQELLEPRAEDVVVLYGDHPLISKRMLQALAEEHGSNHNVLTLATTVVPDFEDWRVSFYDFGRIIRGKDGSLKRSVEKKDASQKELEIKELNPCYYCFMASWLWPSLEKLKPNNAQGEYYLTDLLQMAVDEKVKIGTILIEPKEAMGVNTKEQLALVEALL